MKLLQFLFPDNKSESFKIASTTKSEFIKRLGDSIKCEKKELFKDVFTIHFREDYFEMEREKLEN